MHNDGPSNVTPAPLADEPELKAPRWVERHLGREQFHILVGGLGVKVSDDDRFALRILQTLLAGQSGRLFLELREKRSLAYSVSPVCFEGMERGYLGTYIACAPGKKEEAISGIQKVLQTIVSKTPGASEMKRAKEFYLGRRAMDLQSDTALATHYGLEAIYDLPYLPDDKALQIVRSVSAKDIQRVCAKYFLEPHLVTSVVG
ncbi:MAG: hypothetical protein A3K03_04460 [Bdellovibrionales bacterium RIFOXYD1_FULL_44_7]|nr:MAG: hypothetical protein A3K03_04460 [Bdellovibrionales bacterium RIFOXYD1_FULL_44_7]